jgi:hypothetical protein
MPLEKLAIIMKNFTQLIIILLLIILKTGYSFSQFEEYTIIRISRISYIQKPFGTVKHQLKIDLESNKVYYRKNLKRKFKEFQTTQNISLFKASLKIERVKEISKLISVNDEECLYHNEYGYYKIELLKLNREDEIYGEMFIINTPYECKDENDQILVRLYLN